MRLESRGTRRRHQNLRGRVAAILLGFRRAEVQFSVKWRSQSVIDLKEQGRTDLKLTRKTTCDSSSWSAPTTRGPRGCACCGNSSSSPVYLGLGRDLKSPDAIEVMARLVPRERVAKSKVIVKSCRRDAPSFCRFAQVVCLKRHTPRLPSCLHIRLGHVSWRYRRL